MVLVAGDWLFITCSGTISSEAGCSGTTSSETFRLGTGSKIRIDSVLVDEACHTPIFDLRHH